MTNPSMYTEDPDDPRLSHGADDSKRRQSEVYLVLSKAERDKGFIRPLRRTYMHCNPGCGCITSMGLALCETYARDPHFYGATYCCGCHKHRPLEEFIWTEDGKMVGS